MACNSNAAAATGSWLSSKNSPHQTIRAHMEKELLRVISHKRRLVAKIALRDAHCIQWRINNGAIGAQAPGP